MLPMASVPATPGSARGRRRLWLILAAAAVAVVLTVGAVFVVRAPSGPAPTGLASSEVTSDSVRLSWSAPPESTTAPDHYRVTRDGTEIGPDVREPQFLDNGLEPGRTYRYEIRAVTDGHTSRATSAFEVKTLPEGARDLSAQQVTFAAVKLGWTAPRAGAPDQFVITRDEAELGTVAGGEATYTDAHPAPGREVTYAVIAVVGGQRAEPVTVTVTAPLPAVALARLSGSWEVLSEVTKNNGTTLKLGDSTSDSWTFTPACASGACPARLTGTFANAQISMPLTRKGAVYRGSTKANVAACRGKKVANTLTLALTVTSGEMNADQWSAQKWTGTLTMSIPYTVVGNYYCPRQSAVFTVTPDGAPTAGTTTTT